MPVTHLGPGVGVERPGGVDVPGTRAGVTEEDVLVLIVEDLVMVDVTTVLREGINFEINGCS